jgi:hypothetical protein
LAAKSNSTADVTAWLEKVLQSCETEEQQDSALRLIDIFERRAVQVKANKWHVELSMYGGNYKKYGGLKTF